jgi:hypothetical protein
MDMKENKVSAANLQSYLKGADYPAGKDALIKTCKSNKCPTNVMSFVQKLPEKDYKSPIDVEKEFGKIKKSSW